MKHFYLGLFLFLSFISLLSAQNTVKMSAVKSNDYGVSYTLPKTILVVQVSYTETIRKAGEFYEYAERYLNIATPITKSETSYEITNIRTTTDGVPNKENSYLVEFKSGSTAPYVTLTKDGLICAINSDAVFDEKESLGSVSSDMSKMSLLNPNTFLSEEILKAGSKSKQAELIAKQIFKLRETKSNILTGEADNMPPDGNAYKLVIEQLNEQEKALTSLFIGTEVRTAKEPKELIVSVPENKNITNEIIFRFSKKLGFVANDDLSGEPGKLFLTSVETFNEAPILTPKEQKDLDKKFSQGIIYNIPGKAELKVEYRSKTWVKEECDVVQYGIQDVLAPKMFENNKEAIKVIFYPNLGAIKQIIQ